MWSAPPHMHGEHMHALREEQMHALNGEHSSTGLGEEFLVATEGRHLLGSHEQQQVVLHQGLG